MQACWPLVFGNRGIFIGDDVGSGYRGELHRTFSPGRMGLQQHPPVLSVFTEGGLTSTATRSALML